MIFLKVLIYPFSILYDLATRIRNYLYDVGYKRSVSFEVPVIAVGNLSVGGTGKTPMIEYLISLLKPQFPIATLSRGYGRSTQGIVIAGPSDTALTLGDEPFQFHRKFGIEVVVAVGEARAVAIPAILKKVSSTKVILLDDAFQHRPVLPALNILLTSFSDPFYGDALLPAGRLREARKGASRADVVVMTKCDPSLEEGEMKNITAKIQEYAGNKPVFFAAIHYGKPNSIKGTATWNDSVVLVSGIAQPDSFEKYATNTFRVVRHFRFADHHRYTFEELQEVVAFAKVQKDPVAVLTTEKDMVRLIDPKFATLLSEAHWFYLPIETRFIKGGAEFDELILNATKRVAKP